MQELPNGQWQLDSAFETEIVSRVAGFGDAKDHARYILKHSPPPNLEMEGEELHPTLDEAVFFHREMKYGKLLISSHIAELAEVGLTAVEGTNETYDGVTPEIAALCLRAIQDSREANAQLDQAELGKPVEAESAIVITDQRPLTQLSSPADLTAA